MPLDTKVRIKLGRLAFSLLLFLVVSCHGSAPKCNKHPLGQFASQTYGDHGFKVSVVGSPRLYRPGQMYTVSLSGERMDEGDLEPKKIKFIDFMIVAESNLPSTEVHGLGLFQLMPGDAMSKFSHKCSHAVMATSALAKEEVQVYWTAPEQGSGCIQLKAMVVERNDYWFMDDGALTYSICEDDSPQEVPVVEPCRACDEAKYEVIFEGLWSRHTHPKDFPSNEWQTQFSQMIGASHSIDYDLWKYGELASPALQMLAESGQTKKLEVDMKRSSRNIRSVIKARGLQQRSNVVGRTFAVFRVDATKHLLSIVSKMIPSPDWIVGVSMENLCLSNGSWVDSRVIDLYPWDAGSNSGMSYQAYGAETQPRESIHRITSCFPEDDASPFYDETCAPIKPVARLHILKQREYKKECPDDYMRLNPSWEGPNAPSINGEVFNGNGIGPIGQLPSESVTEPQYSYGDYDNQPPYGDESRSRGSGSRYSSSGSGSRYSSSASSSYGSSSSQCDLTEWSKWSSCGQTCDSGSRSRSRKYVNKIGSQISNCNDKVFEKQPCRNLPKCETKSYGGSFDPFFSEDELSKFSSPWSNRGLSPRNLVRETEEDKDEVKSYLYETNSNPQRQVGNPADYEALPTIPPPVDPYHDPYNQYSGYKKQKGYPPRTNHPSSSRYNPYKDMGYYGYTYAGPPSHRYNQPNYMADDGNEMTSLDMMSSDSSGYDVTRDCDVTEWGDWSHCSTDCGTGTRTRTRHYTDMNTSFCTKELFEDDSCEVRSGCYDDLNTVEDHEVTTKNYRFNRDPVTKKYFTEAAEVTTLPPRLPEADHHRDQRHRGQQKPAKRGQGHKKPRRRRTNMCAVANWTSWSPCSVTCGTGYKIRTRVYLIPFIPNRVCDIRLTQKMVCREKTCWSSDYYDEDTPVALPVHDYDDGNVGEPNEPYCSEDPNPGFCYGSMDQWFYNATSGQCGTFKYTGCAGNKNNFKTESECMDACSPGGYIPKMREDYEDEDIPLGDDPRTGDKIDCEVSSWSSWSPCSVSCGRGWMTMERNILVHPRNGGRSCPRKLTKRRRCTAMDCDNGYGNWYADNLEKK